MFASTAALGHGGGVLIGWLIGLSWLDGMISLGFCFCSFFRLVNNR